MPLKTTKWYSIKAAGNATAEVFIYDEIGGWGITAADFVNALKEFGDLGVINVRINSMGGDVSDGLAIYNYLKSHKAEVNVHIDGVAFSMASIVAMSGDKVTMPSNAVMMIHNPAMGARGDQREMQKAAEILAKFKGSLVSIYVAKTGLEAEEVEALMDEETWMVGTEAVEKGFADETTDAVDLAAVINVDVVSEKLAEIIASQTSTTIEVTTMPKEVQATNPSPPEATNPPPVDDSARLSGIRDAFSGHEDQNDLLVECLADVNCTIEAAQRKLLKRLGEKSEPVASDVPYITVGVEDRDKFKLAAINALSVRANLGDDDPQNEYRGHTLFELARASLAFTNVSLAGKRRYEIVGMAFTHSTSDFDNILADIANKALLRGYTESPETFGLWTRPGNLSDFKTAKRVGLSEFTSLDEVPEGEEFRHGTIGDRGENIKLLTYGKLFSITRQAIINDDLSSFTSIPGKMGRAASRKVGDLAYGVLTTNPTMSDGVALFHANHNNLAGSGAAVSVTTLGAGRTAMGLQKDSANEATALNIRPAYLLTPLTIQDNAQTVISSETDPSQANSRKPNPVRNMAEVISDARLDANSTTAWYLAADQNVHDTVEVAYLDGDPNPFIEQQRGWSVDGVEFKVRIDAGVAPLEFRTFWKNPGA